MPVIVNQREITDEEVFNEMHTILPQQEVRRWNFYGEGSCCS